MAAEEDYTINAPLFPGKIIAMGNNYHEHIKEMLIGSILWVEWGEIIKSLVVYALIGAFHYFFRNKFLPLSENYVTKAKVGNARFWDFIFYATLGIVVMHSVRIGGILVVFAFLIIPASISALFSNSWSKRITIGWITGTLVSILGLYLSWKMDVPSGPAVVLFLAMFLLLSVIVKTLQVKRNN